MARVPTAWSLHPFLDSWYTSLFPERVGRRLLDISINFAGTFDDAALLTGPDRRRAMDDVLAPYVARYPFAGGNANEQPAASTPQTASSAPYKDMERAQEIMRRIHQEIGKSNQRR